MAMLGKEADSGDALGVTTPCVFPALGDTTVFIGGLDVLRRCNLRPSSVGMFSMERAFIGILA